MECAMSMTGIQESFNLDSSGSNKVSGETIGGGLNLAFDLFGVSTTLDFSIDWSHETISSATKGTEKDYETTVSFVLGDEQVRKVSPPIKLFLGGQPA